MDTQEAAKPIKNFHYNDTKLPGRNENKLLKSFRLEGCKL